LPGQWVDYDPVKKQIVQPPQLPAFAIPQSKAKPARRPSRQDDAVQAPHALPASGAELHRRLQDYDGKLAEQKVCNRGALLAHVTRAGVQAGYSENLADWNGEAIALADEVVKEFEQSIRDPRSDRPRAAA
jgi:hypothetical protein